MQAGKQQPRGERRVARAGPFELRTGEQPQAVAGDLRPETPGAAQRSPVVATLEHQAVESRRIDAEMHVRCGDVGEIAAGLAHRVDAFGEHRQPGLRDGEEKTVEGPIVMVEDRGGLPEPLAEPARGELVLTQRPRSQELEDGGHRVGGGR
jgi:hypothetical protein